MPTNDKDKKDQGSGTGGKGFASMPHKKVEEIASKGGQASSEKAGHEGMSERGHKGGAASSHASRGKESSTDYDEDSSSGESNGNMKNVSPATVEKYLKGVHFPANKKDLIKQANQNSAPREVSELIEQFDDGDYKNVTEISQEIKKLIA